MKQHIVLGFVLLLCISQTTFGQVVIPHTIPCLNITPENILTLPSGIGANDCIIADGDTVYFKPDQHYSIRAGEYIEFNENTVITPDGSHQFHAYIQKEELDLAWYYPNETPGTVGKFEKLEIGIQFDSTIQNKINRFVNREAGTKLNPFNPEDVDVYAEFWIKIEDSWYLHKRVNAFYYQEFSRNIDTLTWDTVATLHNFRVRYAPPVLGTFRCRITSEVFGHDTIIASDFTFEVVPSSNKGFMEVGENKRYFEFGEEPFFPVGHNLSSPQNILRNSDYEQFTVVAYGYQEYARRLRKLKESGGNYFRYIVSPWNTEIEFENLGDYSNRMTNAWEFDKILDTTKALGLKMHMNMAVHFTFEAPNGYLKLNWDWSAAGDTLNTPISPLDEAGCFREYDEGYCYRRELDIEHPRDFFTDSLAIKHYKNRIRYMEARWGYSTEIAVTEILSEAGHTGSRINLGLIDGECKVINETLSRPYHDDSLVFPHDLFKWHLEMADYMNDSLKSAHLISVNYPGEPSLTNFDYSYYLADVDINTYNHYGLRVDNQAALYEIITERYHDIDHNPWPYYYSNKPFMNSEYGTGTDTYLCDQDAEFIRRVYLCGFTGLAAVPMTWDSQWDEQNVWHYYQNINDLMAGIQLDNENWKAGEPIVLTDNKIEVLYLRKGETGADSKIVGALANRTFNFWSQRLGHPCDSAEYKPIDEYLASQNFDVYDLSDPIEIKNLGSNKPFNIEWYNAITGELLHTTGQSSNVFGKMNLVFVDTLTGNSDCPIIFFKFYPSDDTFLSPIGSNEFENVVPQEFQLAQDLIEMDATPWQDSTNTSLPFISVSPNPTTGVLYCKTNGNVENLTWFLVNSNGQQLAENKISSPNFIIDLSVYENGAYFLLIQDLNGGLLQSIKIVKQ
jgi:hypothetical protein